jgi:hypothetical protein
MPRIRMNENAGVVGEDKTDWLGGTEHECSDNFAIHLVSRGVAQRIHAQHASGVQTIANADPAIETRDPVGLDTATAAPIAKPPSKKGR